MKKIFTTALLLLSYLSHNAQITVSSAIVPQYVQGLNSTNNNRTPFIFWATISGLTPNAQYNYYTSLDSINAISTSSGVGNPYLINITSGTVRRSSNASLSNPAGYDSLMANASGTYSGWFMVEPTSNARFTPGYTVVPQLILNDGSGGTSVAHRLRMVGYPVTVINFGTSAGSATQGTALYDSADVNLVPAKSFAFLYDNNAASNRPISIAIVEDDGVNVSGLTTTPGFYKTKVDGKANHWGTIIPNNLANGIQRIDYHNFNDGTLITPVIDSPNDGNWCSGINTVNMNDGSVGTFLNSTFSPNVILNYADTVEINQTVQLVALPNNTSLTVDWLDMGDTQDYPNTDTVNHTYTSTGMMYIQVQVTNGICTTTIDDSIYVKAATTSSINVTSAIVPQYMQGGLNGSSNDNRTPFAFWATISGLNPNATYKYYTVVDSINAASNSTGAGNSYFINAATGTVRRTNANSLSVVNGYDSLVTNANGVYSGWFMLESTNNPRFTPGKILAPQLMLNDGNNGAAITTRLRFVNYPVTVINYGNTSADSLQGTALYDSASISNVSPKDFVFLYDTNSPTSNTRPISIAIVEDDALNLNLTTTASFYKTYVDGMANRWGTIIPNKLPNGIQFLEYRNFNNGSVINGAQISDVGTMGLWCSGINTINMGDSVTGTFLNSNLVIDGFINAIDTIEVNQPVQMAGVPNTPNATLNWTNVGDGTDYANTDTITHTYSSTGMMQIELEITTGECATTIYDSIYVKPSIPTSIKESTSSSITIYPNPANEYIVVKATSDKKDITVYDVIGNKVYSKSDAYDEKLNIDISKLAKGIYIIHVVSEKGNKYTKRIVKN